MARLGVCIQIIEAVQGAGASVDFFDVIHAAVIEDVDAVNNATVIRFGLVRVGAIGQHLLAAFMTVVIRVGIIQTAVVTVIRFLARSLREGFLIDCGRQQLIGRS